MIKSIYMHISNNNYIYINRFQHQIYLWQNTGENYMFYKTNRSMFTKRSNFHHLENWNQIIFEVTKSWLYQSPNLYFFSKGTKYAQNPFIMTFSRKSEFVLIKYEKNITLKKPQKPQEKYLKTAGKTATRRTTKKTAEPDEKPQSFAVLPQGWQHCPQGLDCSDSQA